MHVHVQSCSIIDAFACAHRVPSTPDPSGFSVVLDNTEFDRIKVTYTTTSIASYYMYIHTTTHDSSQKQIHVATIYASIIHACHPPHSQRGARVLNAADKKLMEDTLKSEKLAKLDASNSRKREMQELEAQRKKNEKPSDLDQVGSNRGPKKRQLYNVNRVYEQCVLSLSHTCL